jgi:predicted ABC-type ATPase
MPTILIIAGPNGAGKTTIARHFLTTEAEYRSFINADLIAAGLSPFSPDDAAIQASRIMLQEISRQVVQGKSFAFETTLSGSRMRG